MALYSVIQFLLSQVRTDTAALIGGKVYFYNPGTTSMTGVYIYLDDAGASPANNPYTLDANGTAQLYASGKYRIVIKDSAGVTKFDRDNISFSPGSAVYYTVVLSADVTLPFSSPFMAAFIDPNGADRNITPAAGFTAGSIVFIYNIGPYAITFDPAGLNQAIGAGGKEYFMLGPSGWR